jgi:uncharacterized protein YecT (DUF1311 family)
MWKSIRPPRDLDGCGRYKDRALTIAGMRATLASLIAAAAIAPPVIHEPFTALPCPLHPDTTVDVIGCQEHRVLRTDRAIDAQVETIFRLLRTDTGRSAFAAGERSWLSYRRQACAAEASRVAGGSLHGVALLGCELRRNTTHLAELTAMRKALARR